MSKMIWKFLIGLIYALNEISFGECTPPKRKPLNTTQFELRARRKELEQHVPKKRKSSTISESEIRARREELEQQHHINYLAEEVVYKNWPEVHENAKHDCQRFLQIIFPMKEDLFSVIPEIRKMILNYKQIRDGNNNMLTPKKVTTLECRLPNILWHRTLITFTRSPQSPECALLLNRIGKKSFNFYIVEDICEHQDYPFIWKYVKELEEDKVERIFRINSQSRQQMKLLLQEDIKMKHAKFEQKHYEYCSVNAGMCSLWLEEQTNLEYECQRFLRKMLPSKDLSSVTASIHSASLLYLEISNKFNSETLDTKVVNALACKFPQRVRDRSYFYFSRAPSYPKCVFYIILKMLLPKYFYIVEEICDTSDHQISLHKIIVENRGGSKFTKNTEPFGYETIDILKEYEYLHFQDYLSKRFEYEEWPELKQMNRKSFCQTLVQNIFPQIAGTSETDKLSAESESVELKYATIDTLSNEKIPLIKVKALKCFISQRVTPNHQFLFIRTPRPNCVYWIRCRYRGQNFYLIVKEVCVNDVGFSELLAVDSRSDDTLRNMEFPMDDEFWDFLHSDVK